MSDIELDTLDQLATRVFEGYVVRKDLARRFKGRYPVPEYVSEFLLGRYCASTDEREIAEGLGIVELQRRESVRSAEGNLLTRARELVGDRDPRQHEFTVQLRAFDSSRTGSFLGLPALLAFCSALLGKSLKGGLVSVGGLNLGGALDPVYNAVSVAELAVEKGATTLLIPISSRKQLNELSDEMAMKLSILYYAEAREGLLKALAE